MENLQVLQSAIENQQNLTVIYLGGSTPGQIREITPIRIKDDKLQAKCLKTNRVKPFFINKLQIVTSDGELINHEAKANVLPQFSNMEELLAAIEPHFSPEQWQIKLQSNWQGIGIFSKFKNGTVKKHPTLSLCYEEYRIELDEGTGEPKQIKRQKPWIVASKGKTSTSYAHLNKASEKFIQWCDEVLSQ